MKKILFFLVLLMPLMASATIHSYGCRGNITLYGNGTETLYHPFPDKVFVGLGSWTIERTSGTHTSYDQVVIPEMEIESSNAYLCKIKGNNLASDGVVIKLYCRGTDGNDEKYECYWNITVKLKEVTKTAINSTNFPDANFRSYLSSQSYGTDGVLTDAEIASVTDIIVPENNNIQSLKGIEFFTALTALYCVENKLTSLDVSKNTALTYLGCGANQLTTLDVSKNTALISLYCYSNQLTSLDVSKNTALKTLSCFGNQLTSLDVSKNTALTSLYCYQNQIKGAAMDALVASLPTASSGRMNVIYNENEGNVMTTTQVAAVKAKGWTPRYYDGSKWQEYAGSEPEPEPEGSIITIGDAATSSSNKMPLGSYDQNSTTQFLYTPSEIGKGGKITSIAFKIATSSSHSTSEMKIYLGHKSGTFSGTDDYVNSSNLTLVYSGSPTIGKSTGWETYAFNQGGFTYNGTDNLVVVVTRKSDNYNTGLKYYCFTGSGYSLRRGNDSNSGYGDVSNTSSSYSTTTERPAIQMEIDDKEVEKCATPTISFADGKLQFSCETEGVEIVSKITCSDSGEYEGTDIPLTAAYTVTAYAKKSGYADSDVATKEINVGGTNAKKGDVNEDGTVNGTDIQEVINIIVHGDDEEKYLDPRVRFGFYETVAGYSVTVNSINVDYNLTIGTDAVGTVLNTTADYPTWDTANGQYTVVQPNEANTNTMLIKLDYTLTSEDGSGENIVVRNAEVVVPTEVLKWQHNKDYTYILKISDNPDWKPTMKLAELFPIALNKVEIIGNSNNNVTR